MVAIYGALSAMGTVAAHANWILQQAKAKRSKKAIS
jgi:hypothetical protein